ncbi:MAG: Na/Pi symporter, partial [Eubacteriales bacterium]|nr:Na/Pi symporter [Eubacteriales bacterium]
MDAMTVFTLLGGLGLFLFGIRAMGEGLEQAAGNRMKRLLEALTKNKALAVLVGALVTGVIQSSSATTVMVVGFVNAGLLSLSKAVGVIMGANIGTTVTSLMLSIKINFGMLFAAVGAICQLAGSRSSFKLFGQIAMGLGLLFLGMDTMSAAMEPLHTWQGFRDAMALARNPLVGVLAGAVITALLQSSSASVGILQALAGTGAISLQASLFILFGQNIGTCVTALLASVGANR